MPFKNFFNDFPRFVFETTGFPLIIILRFVAVLIFAVVAIGLTVLYTNAEPSSEPSGIASGNSIRQTSEEQFIAVSELPPGFAEKEPIEKIDILKSKIEAGEQLARSGGHYAERATDQLVSIYGVLCKLQDLEGLDSQKSYQRLAAIRQEASAAGNEDRVASADFLRAFAATSRLNQCTERADFRFATDAVLNLNSKKLVDMSQVNQLYLDAIKLHDNSSEKDSTAIFLSVLGDKLNGSPTKEISNLGLNLKDHGKYARYYEAVVDQPYSNRESKQQFFNELFAEIEKAPPQSPKTYQVVVELLDKLLNGSDAEFAGSLTKRLGKAASMMSPRIKADVDKAIIGIETRISLLGQTLDLSGSKSDGSQLQLPNGKPTTIVFWQFGNEVSMEHIQALAVSDRFDAWENNVLMASLSTLNEAHFKKADEIIGKFTILDNDTSHRLANAFGIDLVPYQVSLDKEGKVIRLGKPTN